MRVYLWEAGDCEGLTDDDGRARDLAAGFMLANGADEALVEPALFDDSFTTVTSGYVRTAGRRWTALRRGDRVVWTSCYVGDGPRLRPLRVAS